MYPMVHFEMPYENDERHIESDKCTSDFRNIFAKMMEVAPTKTTQLILKAAWLDTPLGPMVTIADNTKLYLLEFLDYPALEREVESLRTKLNAAIVPGETSVIESISLELSDYFAGKNFVFKTPIQMLGSPFQKNVWGELVNIPPGETRSYLQVSKALNKPTAFRAVAQANGANQLAIIIPCHRVINSNGEIGGYSSGVARKKWLLEHEKKC